MSPSSKCQIQIQNQESQFPFMERKKLNSSKTSFGLTYFNRKILSSTKIIPFNFVFYN